MDDVLNSLARLFTDTPYVYLSWPAVAMVLGWAIAATSASATKSLALTPRTARGLIGLITGPFVHANLAHLTANLPPFLVLGALMLRRGETEFLEAAAIIWIAQGALLWLMGRNAAHVGMSGVIFGFFGYLIAVVWFTRSTDDLLIAAGVLVFYGSMLAGVAPARDGTSWEGHLFGLLAGIGAAWYQFAW